jgi:hypothetical protein
MYASIFYGILYLITLALIGLKLLNIYVIPILSSDDIYSFIQIVNYISLYLYFTSFLKLLRNYSKINLSNWYKLKISYCIFNSYVVTFMISYIIYQTFTCYKNDCLNNDQYIYDIFGIVMGLIYMVQLLIHLIIPIYKLKEQSLEQQDDNKHFRKLKILYILFNICMFYNFAIVLHIPLDVSYLIYYVYLYFSMIVMYSFLQITNIESLFCMFLLILSQILFINNVILNIYVISFTSISNIYVNINLGFSLIFLCMYIFINIQYLRNKYRNINMYDNSTPLRYIYIN